MTRLGFGPWLWLWLTLAAWALYALGVTAYVLGSYLVMHRRATQRPLSRSIREMAREGWLTLVTQPFLPLFYVVGRRLGGSTGGQPVVLVHGYAQNRIVFIGLARELRKRGVGPLYAFNYAWFSSIDRVVGRLQRFVDAVCTETGSSQVDIVTHSYGGLVALEYLHVAPEPRVRRLVTIAGPHAGVLWRGPFLGGGGTVLRAGGEFFRDRSGRRVTVPCLSVYSTHDNIVFPSTTSALSHRGGMDLAASEAGHLAILFDRSVGEQVATFLRQSDAAVV